MYILENRMTGSVRMPEHKEPPPNCNSPMPSRNAQKYSIETIYQPSYVYIKSDDYPKTLQESPSLAEMKSWMQKHDTMEKHSDENISTFNKQAIKYSTETSLHGIKYITEEGRHWTERYTCLVHSICLYLL